MRELAGDWSGTRRELAGNSPGEPGTSRGTGRGTGPDRDSTGRELAELRPCIYVGELVGGLVVAVPPGAPVIHEGAGRARV